jgi:hypothetical protein
MFNDLSLEDAPVELPLYVRLALAALVDGQRDFGGVGA